MVEMARTKEIPQLSHSNHTCQLSGPRNVLRNKPIPVARELMVALLNKN
jgi:hypothetical protein